MKLWRVSQVLGDSNPFSEQILALTEPQMDFILTMRAQDRPTELKFERRRDMLARIRQQNEITSRANVYSGKALEGLRARVSFKLPAAYLGKTTVRRGVAPPKEMKTPPRPSTRPRSRK